MLVFLSCCGWAHLSLCCCRTYVDAVAASLQMLTQFDPAASGNHQGNPMCIRGKSVACAHLQPMNAPLTDHATAGPATNAVNWLIGSNHAGAPPAANACSQRSPQGPGCSTSIVDTLLLMAADVQHQASLDIVSLHNVRVLYKRHEPT